MQAYHMCCPQEGQEPQVQTHEDQQRCFLGGVTSTDLASLTEGLTTLFTGGSEEEEGTKFVEWGVATEMLSTKLKPVLSKGDF